MVVVEGGGGGRGSAQDRAAVWEHVRVQHSRWSGVSSSPSHLPGCALGALMPYNLAKIARGMLAYSQSSESPGCSRGKPCGKHALNRTRCCMYNVVNIRSQASEYHNPNLAHLGASEWGHFRFLKLMRLIIMIGEDVGSRGGAGMTGDNTRNQSDPSHRLDLVSNERRSESFVRMRAPGERKGRSHAGSQPPRRDASQRREGRAIPSVTTEPRDLIVPVRIGTNSNHLFQIY